MDPLLAAGSGAAVAAIAAAATADPRRRWWVAAAVSGGLGAVLAELLATPYGATRAPADSGLFDLLSAADPRVLGGGLVAGFIGAGARRLIAGWIVGGVEARPRPGPECSLAAGILAIIASAALALPAALPAAPSAALAAAPGDHSMAALATTDPWLAAPLAIVLALWLATAGSANRLPAIAAASSAAYLAWRAIEPGPPWLEASSVIVGTWAVLVAAVLLAAVEAWVMRARLLAALAALILPAVATALAIAGACAVLPNAATALGDDLRGVLGPWAATAHEKGLSSGKWPLLRARIRAHPDPWRQILPRLLRDRDANVRYATLLMACEETALSAPTEAALVAMINDADLATADEAWRLLVAGGHHFSDAEAQLRLHHQAAGAIAAALDLFDAQDQPDLLLDLCTNTISHRAPPAAAAAIQWAIAHPRPHGDDPDGPVLITRIGARLLKAIPAGRGDEAETRAGTTALAALDATGWIPTREALPRALQLAALEKTGEKADETPILALVAARVCLRAAGANLLGRAEAMPAAFTLAANDPPDAVAAAFIATTPATYLPTALADAIETNSARERFLAATIVRQRADELFPAAADSAPVVTILRPAVATLLDRDSADDARRGAALLLLEPVLVPAGDGGAFLHHWADHRDAATRVLIRAALDRANTTAAVRGAIAVAPLLFHAAPTTRAAAATVIASLAGDPVAALHAAAGNDDPEVAHAAASVQGAR